MCWGQWFDLTLGRFHIKYVLVFTKTFYVQKSWLLSSADLVKSDWFADIIYISYRHRGWFWLKLYYLDWTTKRIICGQFDLIFLSNVRSKVQGNLSGLVGVFRGVARGECLPAPHTKWPLLFFYSNLRFHILGLADHHYIRPTPMIS